MSQANFTIERPKNEPVLSYAPGSKEKTILKSAIAHCQNNPIDIPLYIGGERIFSGHVVPITSPHNHSLVIAHAHLATNEHIEFALASSQKAHKEWSSLGWYDRAAVFIKAAELLATDYRARMNAATIVGQSKTCFQAEIDAACELIDFFRFNAYFAAQIGKEQPGSLPSMWNRSEARGLEGFVYAISPFNFSSIAVNLAAAPALMGCSVLWKPALTSLLSSWVGMELLEASGLPPGVINMIPSDPRQLSAKLLPHKSLAGIHFTGSTATFNMLYSEIGKNIHNYASYPRIVGETGGKDFVFAHESANPEELITALIRGAFEYQGQKCSAASRAYIPKKLWEQIRPELVSQTNQIKMGDPSDFSNFMGAVIDRPAYERITNYIKNASSLHNTGAKKDSQTTVIAGGEYDDKNGYFVRPTIIETTNPHYATMVEEIFGPVLTVYPYDESAFEKTLDLCDNSTAYALTGAIFAKDRRIVAHMTQRLANAAGNFYINDKPTGAVVGQQPFGGSRASGTNDKAGSIYNLIRWTSHRTIKENFASIKNYRYAHMDEV